MCRAPTPLKRNFWISDVYNRNCRHCLLSTAVKSVGTTLSNGWGPYIPPPHPYNQALGYLYMLVPHHLKPPPPILGKGYTPYLGYWLPLVITTKKKTFPGFLGKSSRDHGQKISPFPEKMGIRMRPPHALSGGPGLVYFCSEAYIIAFLFVIRGHRRRKRGGGGGAEGAVVSPKIFFWGGNKFLPPPPHVPPW